MHRKKDSDILVWPIFDINISSKYRLRYITLTTNEQNAFIEGAVYILKSVRVQSKSIKKRFRKGAVHGLDQTVLRHFLALRQLPNTHMQVRESYTTYGQTTHSQAQWRAKPKSSVIGISSERPSKCCCVCKVRTTGNKTWPRANEPEKDSLHGNNQNSITIYICRASRLFPSKNPLTPYISLGLKTS